MKRAIILATIVLFPTFAFAQFSTSGVDSLTLSLTPSSPRPNQQVLVTPQSTLIDLANSTMTLSVNGKTVYTGATQPVPITVGANGQTTLVSVTVSTSGGSYTKKLALSPGDVSLIVEPQSTTHALYLGKPLLAEGSVARVVAIADFRTSGAKRIDPDTLSYTWIVDGTTLQNASGIGKSSLVVPAPLPYRKRSLTVQVSSRDSSIQSAETIDLASQTPTLRLYILDPLQGPLFDHALAGSYTISDSEKTFFAVPFSMALNPQVNWYLNGSGAQSGPLITLRPEGSGQGSATLSATASGSGQAADATASLGVQFGTRNSFFGL